MAVMNTSQPLRAVLDHASFERCWAHLDHVRAVVSNNGGRASAAQLDRAIAVLMLCHVGQKPRPDGTPYVEHPAQVARNVAEWAQPLDLDLVIAALLHDSVEDQSATLCRLVGLGDESREGAIGALRGIFGPRVAALVGLLSNPELLEGMSREDKNDAYRVHVRGLIDSHPDALTVKLADFWTNALQLKQVPDVSTRRRLEAKYLPVMEDLLLHLRTQPPPSLAHVVPKLVSELEQALAESETGPPGPA